MEGVTLIITHYYAFRVTIERSSCKKMPVMTVKPHFFEKKGALFFAI